MDDIFIWIGIVACISQSAMFSGLNLAVFSVGRLRLQVEAARHNQDAIKVLKLRSDANFCLATILWGNVGVNVLLTMLADSVLAGVFAFLFSTVVITLLGEIVPQAYFSRNALRIASKLSPVLRAYQYLLYFVTRPTAMALDRWLGPETTSYLAEDRLRELIRQHMRTSGDVDAVEGIGAINFLALDDIAVGDEGEPIDPHSIIALPFNNGKPEFPVIKPDVEDAFLRQVQRSGKSWVVITDMNESPELVLDASGFLRAVMFRHQPLNAYSYCHRPIIVRDEKVAIGDVLGKFKVHPEHPSDDVIDDDVIVVWGKKQKRIITGSDILGRLLRGIVKLDWQSALQSRRSMT